jgi:hypothetical protein
MISDIGCRYGHFTKEIHGPAKAAQEYMNVRETMILCVV